MSKRLFRDPFQRVFFADGAAMAVFGGSDGAPIHGQNKDCHEPFLCYSDNPFSGLKLRLEKDNGL